MKFPSTTVVAATACIAASATSPAAAFAPSWTAPARAASSPITGASARVPVAPSAVYAHADESGPSKHSAPALLMSRLAGDDNEEERVEHETLVPTSIGNEARKDVSSLKNPKPAFFAMTEKLFGTGKSAMMASAAMAFMIAMLASPMDANAAMSGGRMGGSFSSSRMPSMSRSAPRMSSYGGGGGYYGGGGYTRSRTIIAPTFSPIIAPGFGMAPGFGFSPFFGGGPGLLAVSRGPSFFDLVFFGGILLAVTNAARGLTSTASDIVSSSSPWGSQWDDADTSASPLGPGTSVVQLSVAMEVPNRDDPNSILNALKRLSNTARTDSRVGVQSLTSQVALEILRRRSSIVSASTKYKHYRNNDKAMQDFQATSIQERSKFEQEQVSQFGGMNYGDGRSSGISSSSSSMDKATMAVITLVLAIDGDSTKVSSGSMGEVQDALRRVAADVRVGDCLQGAEILWTPEDRSETLTLRDVAADYPELRSV